MFYKGYKFCVILRTVFSWQRAENIAEEKQLPKPQERVVHSLQDQDSWILAELLLPSRIADTAITLCKHSKYLSVMEEVCK